MVPTSSPRAGEPQSTGRVLMVRPASFGHNPETSATNTFQRVVDVDPGAAARRARQEFDGMVATLRAHGVEVEVIEDTPEPPRPDAVFPNNWISFHAGGTAVLYPLLAPSRRTEVRPEIVEELARRGRWRGRRVLDLRAGAAPGEFLEGTGSLVLDRARRVAYACRSARTSEALLRRFCDELGYEALAFDAHDAEGRAIYHTNVMMSVGTGFAVVCAGAIGDPRERARVVGRLEADGHEVVAIDPGQMADFAGNVLEVRPAPGVPLLVLSARAARCLRPEQRTALERYARLVPIELDTIETLGGGSARCMLAELPL